MTKQQNFSDGNWHSADGLRLHYRDYRTPGGGRETPVICLHGLTRNARDFAELATVLSGSRRVLVPEMRGRGDSEYSPDPATYTPQTYVADVLALLDREGISRAIFIGTSLGGLMTMVLSMQAPERIAAVVLNDIGPEIDAGGLDRIRGYVGQGRSYPTWIHAARALQENHADAHPAFTLEDWLEMAKRGMDVQQSGRIGYDYDMKIAEPFAKNDGAAPPDLWPAYESLSNVPVLLIRGALSDLLSTETFIQMQARLPDAIAVTVPNTGHAPMLTEPESLAAITALLDRVA